jgi:NAD(P)H-dependent flavin oxidoreductase YrpB (nitropropane dioxygenase family)
MFSQRKLAYAAASPPTSPGQDMTLTQWLDIPFPIIQAPMAGVQGSRLAIAVSEAGALGSLPAAMLSGAQLQAELQALQVLGKSPTTSTSSAISRQQTILPALLAGRPCCNPITSRKALPPPRRVAHNACLSIRKWPIWSAAIARL